MTTRWRAEDLGDWTGRSVVVTGGNSGIGKEAARELVRRGADVVLACRDAGRGERAARELGASAAVLDVADLDAVAAFPVPDRLDALVCNAGVMAPPYLPTLQGIESQMATNHLGHAALVSRLWPALVAARGRVVSVSSIAARGGSLSPTSTTGDLVDPQPYVPMDVYRATKQANLLFALELHERAAGAVSAVACHPGVSSTDLFARHAPRAVRLAQRAVMTVVLQSATAGAQPTLRALDPATPSGTFVGPRLLGQVRGRPELLEVYASAADPAVRARLWDLTEQVLGHPLLPVAA